MQEDVINVISKNKDKLPMWVAQFELIDLLKKTTDINYVCMCNALSRMRTGNYFEFKEINSCENDKNNYIIVLKKTKRNDLLKHKDKFYRGSFLYKIKEK